MISASPCPQGYFLADIAVTSPDGETHQTTASFNMGKPCYINADIPAEVDAKHPLEAKLQLTDYDGKKRDGVIVYKIAKQLKTRPMITTAHLSEKWLRRVRCSLEISLRCSLRSPRAVTA